jgi:hypothetical protein
MREQIEQGAERESTGHARACPSLRPSVGKEQEREGAVWSLTYIRSVTESKDEWIYRPHGKIQIWSRGDLWYVRWLPDEGNPGYPGHTYDSDKYGIPTDRGLDGVIVWATEQSWYEPATAD